MKMFKNLMDFMAFFNTEKKCHEFLKSVLWKDGCVCPHCGGKEVMEYKSDFKKNRCKTCKMDFSIRKGTIFEESRMSLQKWFMCIYLMCSNKKGISSLSLARQVGINKTTAWFVLHRLRHISGTDLTGMLGGVVEVDEAYFGGKAENMHMNKRIAKKGVYEKTIALGMVSRTDGKVKIKQVPDTTSKTLQTEIHKNIKEHSVLITDELKAYHSISNTYNHHSVNHSAGQYVNGEAVFEKRDLGRIAVKIHTNSIESVWSHLKRGINGIYHWASKKHFQKYFDEYAYRFNTRDFKDNERFVDFLSSVKGRLKYKELVAGV